MTPDPSEKRCFTVITEITACDDCPGREYGLRKCGEANRWFDDGEEFEPENEIAPWCPKYAKKARALDKWGLLREWLKSADCGMFCTPNIIEWKMDDIDSLEKARLSEEKP